MEEEGRSAMRILVLQHVSVEHPGVFREFWTANHDEWKAVELDAGELIPSLNEFDLMVVMGGPMDVWQEDIHPWLRLEKNAIRRWVEDLGKPFLGVCLGHQLLAAALGGEVNLMTRPEVGLADVELTSAGQQDRLLAGFPSKIETFQWHGAEISRLPDGAVVLAANEACPVQAIRWGRHAYGFQYHCEITAATVSEWQQIPEYKASLDQALGAEEASRLEQRVLPKLPAFHTAASRLNANLSSIVMAGLPLAAR
jgi:GMP synthase-like glutamine amidotransferase